MIQGNTAGAQYEAPEYLRRSSAERSKFLEDLRQEYLDTTHSVNMEGPQVMLRPRPDIDIESRINLAQDVREFSLKAVNKMGVFEVMRRGPARVRFGFVEETTVDEGDLVLLSLRRADGACVFRGLPFFVTAFDKLVARIHRTKKIEDPPEAGTEARKIWNEEDFWTIEMLGAYCLLATDEQGFREMFMKYRGEGMLHLPGKAYSDGVGSDNDLGLSDVVYRRFISAGPGRRILKPNWDTDRLEVEMQRCDAPIGSMVAMNRVTQLQPFRFSGRDLSICEPMQVLFYDATL